MKPRFSLTSRAQSLVELAISLMVIVLLLSGVIEFGIAFFQFVQMQDAAQEGAVYGSINPTDEAGIRTRILAVVNEPFDLGLTAGNITITDNGGRCEGYALTITITYDHIVTMPLISTITGPTIPLRATVTDTILQPTCP
ncbi:MAG: TadE/TadG family type IV pilus assembly protein [Anaerolineales bacterium]